MKIFNKENKWISFGVISIFSAFLVLTLVITLGTKYSEFFSNLGKLGPVGDLIGGSTLAFFNIASFFMLIAAIVMQKEELRLQREEIKSTRKEFEQQNETMKTQRFENTFFNMISLLNEIPKDFKGLSGSGHTVSGREALTSLNDMLWREYDIEPNKNFIKSYEKLYDENQYMLGHYFRQIYRVIKLIDESDIKDKKTYIGILKAQFSTYELLFILYNSISEHGEEKMLPLIKKYNVLDNLNKDLIISDIDESLYK